MKKYIIPALRIADINNETILAGSGEVGVDPNNNITGPQRSRERDGLFDWNDNEE